MEDLLNEVDWNKLKISDVPNDVVSKYTLFVECKLHMKSPKCEHATNAAFHTNTYYNFTIIFVNHVAHHFEELGNLFILQLTMLNKLKCKLACEQEL